MNAVVGCRCEAASWTVNQGTQTSGLNRVRELDLHEVITKQQERQH